MPIKEYPFYLKSTIILFGLTLFFLILFTLGNILVPFCFAVLIAILLNPFCSMLQRRIPKLFAVIITLLIATTILGSIIWLLTKQIAQFGESVPALKSKFESMIDSLEHYVDVRFGVSTDRQVVFIKEALNSSQAFIGKTIGTVLGTVGVMVIIPTYVFMMLFYKPLILNFLFEVFKEEHSKRVGEILKRLKLPSKVML